MPDDLDLLFPTQRDSRSKLRRLLAVIFIIALAGIFALTLQLPHIVKRKPPTMALLWSALAMFALALTIGGIFLWFVADRLKDSANEFRRVQGIVQASTGTRTQYSWWLSPVKRWHVIAVLAGVPAFVALVYFLTRWLVPNWPWWAPVVAIWVVGLILAVLQDRRSQPSVRPSLWRTLLNLSLWFALFVLVTRFDPKWVSHYISPNIFLILVTASCLALPFIVWGFGFLPIWWIFQAVGRADYGTALRRADLLLRISPNNAGFRFFRGTTLLFAGRYSEAELGLRESAEAADLSASRAQSATLANLAEAVMLQGRYDEALRQFEAAVQIHPGWGRGYSGIAEVYLWRDMEAERALRFVDLALERKLRSWFSRHLDRHVLAQMYADRAWALALLGRTGESRAELEIAFRAAGRRFRPGIASIHYRAGRALLALHDKAEAGEHFRCAQDLDSGSSGIQAAEMLRRAAR